MQHMTFFTGLDVGLLSDGAVLARDAMVAYKTLGSVQDDIITASGFVGMAAASVASHKSSSVSDIADVASEEIASLWWAQPILLCGMGWQLGE